MSAIEAARSLRKGRGDRSVADLLQEKPDALVGARSHVSGMVRHATLLRIEGRYEGTVPSTVGDVIIGEHGECEWVPQRAAGRARFGLPSPWQRSARLGAPACPHAGCVTL